MRPLRKNTWRHRVSSGVRLHEWGQQKVGSRCSRRKIWEEPHNIVPRLSILISNSRATALTRFRYLPSLSSTLRNRRQSWLLPMHLLRGERSCHSYCFAIQSRCSCPKNITTKALQCNISIFQYFILGYSYTIQECKNAWLRISWGWKVWGEGREQKQA